MTRKVCNRNHSNESKTMRDTESQMQRAPVHEDLMIFTIGPIKDLEPRYNSFHWRNCCSCATNMELDSSRISELLQEPTFFLLRQRSDSDQRSSVHRAYRCYHHHHRLMAFWPTAQTMAANDVRGNFLGSSSRRPWQSRQMFRVEFRTRGVTFKQR